MVYVVYVDKGAVVEADEPACMESKVDQAREGSQLVDGCVMENNMDLVVMKDLRKIATASEALGTLKTLINVEVDILDSHRGDDSFVDD